VIENGEQLLIDKVIEFAFKNAELNKFSAKLVEQLQRVRLYNNWWDVIYAAVKTQSYGLAKGDLALKRVVGGETKEHVVDGVIM
jgi:hypothetical protein